MGVHLNLQKTNNNHSIPGCCAFLNNFKNQFIEFIKSIFCCFPWAHATPSKNISSAQFPIHTDQVLQNKVETVKKKILPSVQSELPFAPEKPATRVKIAKYYGFALGKKYSDFTDAAKDFARSPTDENLDKVKEIRNDIVERNNNSLKSYSCNDPKHLALFTKRLQETDSIETIMDECIEKISERFS